MKVAWPILLSQSVHGYNKKLEEFIRGAIEDFIQNVNNMKECVLRREIKDKIVEHLNNTDVYSLFTIIKHPGQFLEEFHKELNLKGDESLIQSTLEIQKFKTRFDNDFYIRSESDSDNVTRLLVEDTLQYNPYARALCK